MDSRLTRTARTTWAEAWAAWATWTLRSSLALAKELGVFSILGTLSAASPPPMWSATATKFAARTTEAWTAWTAWEAWATWATGRTAWTALWLRIALRDDVDNAVFSLSG